MEFVIPIVGVLVVLCFLGYFLKNRDRGTYEAGTILMLGNKTASDMLDEIELHNVSMRLKSNEACYYEGIGYSYHSKEVVSGYRHRSYGHSVRMMKGVSTHRSRGQSDAIRETVSTAYEGRLYITNERIVFLAERYGFDISFDKLSNITMYNEHLEVFAGSKFYRVHTSDCVFIRDLITLMNMCHEDQYPEDDVDDDNTFDDAANVAEFNEEKLMPTHQLAPYAKPSNAMSSLWNYGTESEWRIALASYDRLIETRNYETQELEAYINQPCADDIARLPVEKFYDFLYEKYFVWKFTQKNYLANSRKHLRRYIEENRLHELADIQRRLFQADHSDIRTCLSIAMEIHGLATAGASGLLSVLFPSDFGTVDQFVVKSLREIDGISYGIELSKMNPNSLTAKDGIILTKIFREKAKELNDKFCSDFWTPRKIDMVLWAYAR